MESKCTVLFLDEIDAIGKSRRGGSEGTDDSCSRRVLAELLMQLNKIADPPPNPNTGRPNDYDGEGINSIGSANPKRVDSFENEQDQPVRVIVVAATNRPDDCDPALLRRFGIKIHVNLPNKSDRKRILKKLLKDIDHEITNAELSNFAGGLEGWSGSELESLAREATMAPVRECIRAAARQKSKLGRPVYPCFRSSFEGAAEDPQQQARDCLLKGFEVSSDCPITYNPVAVSCKANLSFFVQ